MTNQMIKNQFLSDENLSQWYLLSDTESSVMADFYIKELSNFSSPMLEVNCGNGVILRELLKRDIVCDGVEGSADQIKICKENLESQGLTALLYNDDFSDFIPQKKYNTIFIPRGTFSMITDYKHAQRCLSNFFSALENGGSLLIETFVPWKGISSSLDKNWKIGKTVFNTDTNQTFVYSHCDSFDFDEQVCTSLAKYELFDEGRLVESRLDTISSRWYGCNEMKLMLKNAGFDKIDSKQIFVKNSLEYSTFFVATKIS